MKISTERRVRPAHVPERPEPDLDHVREALREHDERVEEDEQAPPPPEPRPEEEPEDPSP